MPGIRRGVAHNCFIHDFRHPETALGGLHLTSGVTGKNFYAWIKFLVRTSESFYLRNENEVTLLDDGQALVPGSYFIVTDGTIEVTEEEPLTRVVSMPTETRVRDFTQLVQERDGGCVVSQIANLSAPFGVWTGFEAAHLFPLAFEGSWGKFEHLISFLPRCGGTINSVQNGILLKADLHKLFDQYIFSIDPDDNYKIVFFLPDSFGLAGTYLSPTLLADERCPPVELFRWHFQQAILTNMKGDGEPVFEDDFPSGSDIMQDIANGPKARERMEFELFNRLAHEVEACTSVDEE